MIVKVPMNMTISVKDENENAGRCPGKAANIDECPYFERTMTQASVPGVNIHQYDLCVYRDIDITACNPGAAPSLFFVRAGAATTRFSYFDEDVRFSNGRHSLLYNPYWAERTVLKSQRSFSVCIVSYESEYFMQLANSGGGIMDAMADRIATGTAAFDEGMSGLRTTLRMYQLLHEINNCPYKNGLQALFLQSRALELLMLHYHGISVQSANDSMRYRISAEDRIKIVEARDIIVERFSDPPSLSQLSRLVGLNEFKLKAGFRSVFSNSVFGYLNDFRLEFCKNEVLKSNKPLSDIAYDAGYSSPAHFSNAFKKKYGTSPLKLR